MAIFASHCAQNAFHDASSLNVCNQAEIDASFDDQNDVWATPSSWGNPLLCLTSSNLRLAVEGCDSTGNCDAAYGTIVSWDTSKVESLAVSDLPIAATLCLA